MNAPTKLTKTVNGKKYSVKAATLLASDEYFAGGNWERDGRNRFLYRTSDGKHFVVTASMWAGEDRYTLRPIGAWAAYELYRSALTEHEVEDAFADTFKMAYTK